MPTPFDRLMDTIRPNLPGAIDTAIKQELFGVCQEFFRESNVWQESLDFTILANQDTAEIMPFAGKLERLAWVINADRTPVNGATLIDPYNGVIRIPYAQAGDYKAQVVLNVSDPVSRDVFPIVPQELLDRYWQVIMHGCLAHMMAQPKKPYTDINLAALYNSKFMGGRARARQEAKELFTLNSQAWSFPQTFNTRAIRRR